MAERAAGRGVGARRVFCALLTLSGHAAGAAGGVLEAGVVAPVEGAARQSVGLRGCRPTGRGLHRPGVLRRLRRAADVRHAGAPGREAAQLRVAAPPALLHRAGAVGQLAALARAAGRLQHARPARQRLCGSTVHQHAAFAFPVRGQGAIARSSLQSRPRADWQT